MFFDALDPSLWIINSCGCWVRTQLFATKKHTWCIPQIHVHQIPSIWNALFVAGHILFVSKDWRVRPSMLRLVDDCYARKAQFAGWDLVIRMEAIPGTLNLMNLHPGRFNIEPESDGLEDDFPFPGVYLYSQVPAVDFPGCNGLHLKINGWGDEPFLLKYSGAMLVWRSVMQAKERSIQVCKRHTMLAEIALRNWWEMM